MKQTFLAFMASLLIAVVAGTGLAYAQTASPTASPEASPTTTNDTGDKGGDTSVGGAPNTGYGYKLR
jgi:hypothetical protein